VPQGLGEGDTLTLTVTRAEPAEGNKPAGTKEWKAIVTVPESGEWRPLFGLAFLPDKNKTYFSKPAGAGSYTITKQDDASGWEQKPAVFWMFHLYNDPNPYIPRLAAGLAIDISNPTPFLGLHWEYKSDIAFGFGVAYEQQKRLSGQYQEGQSITEILSSDSLSQSVYRPNYYVAFAYYFGSKTASAPPEKLDGSDKK
jgi:hypothetical protein